ncbi:Ig-like domain-containing protein, partial [Candidatus Uhrbacteria bacterium]|nr:Ig-like domain-containing protein [Candidatus Uhrbacteria bacterium]
MTLGTAGNANITSHTTAPTIAYTDGATTAVGDTAGNQMATFAATSISDAAAPMIVSFTYRDNDGDGKIDRIQVAFSETLNASSSLSANDLTFTSVGDFTGLAFGSSTTDLLTSAVSSVNVDLGTESTVVDTAENAGTIAISTQNGFSITDGTTTNSTLGAQTQASFVDGAAPRLVSSDPVNDEQNVSRIDALTLTFSEPMNTSSFTYTCCGTATDPGQREVAWGSSNTVATITHAQFQPSSAVTIEITAAPDMASSANAFGGAITGSSANPFSFTTQSAGGVTAGVTNNNIAGGGTRSATLTLVSPNGGESYKPGEEVTIAWMQTGRIDSVNVLYSKDDGSTWEAIERGMRNLGNVKWMVPDITSSTMRVMVQATDFATIYASDQSDSAFAIVSVTVEAPAPEPAPTPEIPTTSEG